MEEVGLVVFLTLWQLNTGSHFGDKWGHVHTHSSNLQLPGPCTTSDPVLWPFKYLLTSFSFVRF